MISIIPALEIMKAFTDKNISSTPSKIRVNAFNSANELISMHKEVEIVIEGMLYSKIAVRLNDDHKKAFNELYDIDDSAVNVEGYNITKAIKFIVTERKLPMTKRRVIIITENCHEYSTLDSDRVKVCTPQKFMECVTNVSLLKKIFAATEVPDLTYSALVAAFFL